MSSFKFLKGYSLTLEKVTKRVHNLGRGYSNSFIPAGCTTVPTHQTAFLPQDSAHFLWYAGTAKSYETVSNGLC